MHERTVLVAWLGAALLLGCSCRGDGRPTIDFEAEHPLYEEQDVESGDVELAPGAAVGLRVRATADVHVIATGEVIAGELEPDDDGGRIRISGHLEIVPNVELDLSSATATGALETIETDFETEEARFQPYAVGESLMLEVAMPAGKPHRMPAVDVPLVAVELVLDPAPGKFLVTWEGVCLEEEGDAMQYTGRLTVDPDLRYAATLEIAIPFVDTQVYGPIEIPLDLPTLDAEPVDLGTYSLVSRRAIEGVQPCAGVEPEAGTGG